MTGFGRLVTEACDSGQHNDLVDSSSVWSTQCVHQFVFHVLHFQLPGNDLGKQQRTGQVCGLLNPRGRTRSSSWILASDQLNPDHCGYLGGEPIDGKTFFSHFCKICLSKKYFKCLCFLISLNSMSSIWSCVFCFTHFSLG